MTNRLSALEAQVQQLEKTIKETEHRLIVKIMPALNKVLTRFVIDTVEEVVDKKIDEAVDKKIGETVDKKIGEAVDKKMEGAETRDGQTHPLIAKAIEGIAKVIEDMEELGSETHQNSGAVIIMLEDLADSIRKAFDDAESQKKIPDKIGMITLMTKRDLVIGDIFIRQMNQPVIHNLLVNEWQLYPSLDDFSNAIRGL